MGYRKAAEPHLGQKGLDIANFVKTGCRITIMANRHMAFQIIQGFRASAEILANMPNTFKRIEFFTIKAHHAGGFLTAML